MIFIWRFGLIALSIYIIAPILVPKVDTTTAFEKPVARLASTAGTVVSKVLLVLMFLSLFKMV